MYYLDYEIYKEFDSSPSCMYKGKEVPAFLSDTNLKWFDEVQDNHIYHKENGRIYYPVSVCVSVRSMYNNKVVCNEKGECYTLKQLHNSLPHREADLIMYETAQVIKDKLVRECPEELNEVMMHSLFQLIGFTVTNKCPVFYSHIVLADEYEDKFSSLLNEGYEFVSISDVSSGKRNPSAIRESLILLKGE